MITAVRPFDVETAEEPGVRCNVTYVYESPDGSTLYCAADANTREQVFTPAMEVENIYVRS
jgi:hypothetical protein